MNGASDAIGAPPVVAGNSNLNWSALKTSSTAPFSWKWLDDRWTTPSCFQSVADALEMHPNGTETALKLPVYFKINWECKVHWNCSENPIWFHGTALKVHWSCTRTDLEIHSNCSETALKLSIYFKINWECKVHWNCSENPIWFYRTALGGH